MNFNHISVLLDECIEGLNIKEGKTYVDGTMGGAGHSFYIAKRLKNTGKLICIDKDENAINAGKDKLKEYSNIEFLHSDFKNIKSIYEELNMDRGIDGMLLDLGVSSHQLDEGYRGFSYMKDAPLDMRMDIRDIKSAYTVVNEYTENELYKIIAEYGEERWAKRIASFIIEERKEKNINTTFELVSIIKKAIPKGARTDGPHPAKRTFQAIRIEVNNELRILENTVNDAVSLLNKEGRLAIITFHSLEDRIIKNAFRNLQKPCICPRELPICVCKKEALGKVITRKPIIPTENELGENHRARSAKLRIFEKY